MSLNKQDLIGSSAMTEQLHFLFSPSCKKAKWLSEKALQIAERRKEAKGKGERERGSHLNAEFQRIARRDKKAFSSKDNLNGYNYRL